MCNNAFSCDGVGLYVRVCVYVYEVEDKQYKLTKIQCFAFVSVTPIHLAWQQPIYFLSCSRMSLPPSSELSTPVEVYLCVESHLGSRLLCCSRVH